MKLVINNMLVGEVSKFTFSQREIPKPAYQLRPVDREFYITGKHRTTWQVCRIKEK